MADLQSAARDQIAGLLNVRFTTGHSSEALQSAEVRPHPPGETDGGGNFEFGHAGQAFFAPAAMSVRTEVAIASSAEPLLVSNPGVMKGVGASFTVPHSLREAMRDA